MNNKIGLGNGDKICAMNYNSFCMESWSALVLLQNKCVFLTLIKYFTENGEFYEKNNIDCNNFNDDAVRQCIGC